MDGKSGLAAVHAAATGAADQKVTAAAPAPGAAPAAPPAEQQASAAAVTTARSEGEAAGRVAERERCKGILGSEHAQGREGLAQHLAFDTDLPVEQATSALQKSPKAEAPRGGSRLDALVPQPKVDAGAGASGKLADDFEAGRQAVLARKPQAQA